MAAVLCFLSSLILFLVASDISAMYSSRALEGYSRGYLGDCPGSTKKAVIRPESLKNLFIAVQGSGPIFQAKITKYTYYQMKRLSKDPNMDFKRKTIFFVGGYTDNVSWRIGPSVCKLYKDLGYNCMMMDAMYFSTRHYPVAVRFMRPVGFHVAEMLSNLTTFGLDAKKLELVGLSLGGQTMSFIAKNFKVMTGTKISRLTGLDPSGPCFRHLGPDQRLDESDADFVEMIATNIDGYGIAAPVGHVNFYVNGGEYQPGDISFWYSCGIVCSHARAYVLWLSVLHNPQASFIAIKCNSVQQARDKDCYDNEPRITNTLGLNVDKTKHGIFYLATHNNYPYYLGDKGLRKENDFTINAMAELNSSPVDIA